ncbi:MAG: RIP metalloprotease [Parvularculaceae bacterium]|nr:RIP metalloprotease [Parvularculaceae bacterium]
MLESLLGNVPFILVSIASFLVMLPLIVFVHELGHFQTARFCGVRIDAFSIGFGPTLASWYDRHGTVWKICAIPLGGYVKFFGDANAASAGAKAQENRSGTTQFGSEREKLEAHLTDDEKKVCFHFKPVWQRALIVAAGPVANFVLAIGILAALFGFLGREVTPAVITQVAEESAAAEAGFEVGDKIVALNGREVIDFNRMGAIIKLSSGEELTFTVERGNDTIELRATPKRTKQQDAFGNDVEVGTLGVGADYRVSERVRFGPIGAVGEGFREVGRIIGITARYFGRLVTFREDPRQIGGPIRIAEYAGQAATSGFDPNADVGMGRRLLVSTANFLQVAALISISVGFLNLLPVPVLDGGHLVFYGYEAVAGKPMPEAVQGVLFRIGLALVFSLIVFVLINDVLRHVGP